MSVNLYGQVSGKDDKPVDNYELRTKLEPIS